MTHTYYVELKGMVLLRSVDCVEVEEILDAEGNVDEKAMLLAAEKIALQDAREDKIEWEDFEDSEVGDIVAVRIVPEAVWTEKDDDEEVIEKETGPF